MAKTTPLSGFPEWLPEAELVQQDMIARVRRRFELHGYGPLQTRSVERVEDLLNQGETDKEIYALQRLAAEANPDEAKLALHYDLTVPFARYVSENRGKLVFPFRRYQIQPAWRGERPQLGRYREFIQADADIIGQDELDLRYESELIGLLLETLADLPIPEVKLMINNRKVLEGFYKGLGIENVVGALRIVDKRDKIGEEGVARSLSEAGLDNRQVEGCLAVARVEVSEPEGLEIVRALSVEHPLLEEGLSELETVLRTSSRNLRNGSLVAALFIARGFDYYTGTVVEGVLADHPDLGSVCSGGRYDDLASGGGKKLPGMGVSIGISRLMGFCLNLGLLQQPRKTPAIVYVLVHSEESRHDSDCIAAALRARGFPCLVADKAAAYGKQIKRANQLGIPYAWFPATTDSTHEVKDLSRGEQLKAELETWEPDPALTGFTFKSNDASR